MALGLKEMDAAAAVPLSAGFLDRRAPHPKQPRLFLAFVKGRVVLKGEALVWLRTAPEGLTVYLGQFEGSALFAADLTAWDEARRTDLGTPSDLWFLPRTLRAEHVALACQGQHLLRWHAQHQHCPRCGHETELKNQGRQRHCPACGHDSYPRTDPAVIMLVQSPDLRCVLLAHSHAMPPGLHSLLAGYVEPGETLEDTVRRETFEEAGVRVQEVRYIASQPWALSGALMCGFTCVAESETLQIDPEELKTAAWYSREDLAQRKADTTFIFPRQHTIARHLLELWIAAG